MSNATEQLKAFKRLGVEGREEDIVRLAAAAVCFHALVSAGSQMTPVNTAAEAFVWADAFIDEAYRRVVMSDA